MKSNFSFKILKRYRKSNARLGKIQTGHGIINTPAFVPVGTMGTVKGLPPDVLKALSVQIFFVNTYHMYLSCGADIVAKFGGLHKFIGWDGSLITDSGGFQIFSLNKGKDGHLCKINDSGVTFISHKDGSTHRFTPEISLDIQKQLGADIILCLDECTYYPATAKYAQEAMKRTHSWAVRSLNEYCKNQDGKQALYGIVQGGIFKQLRKESAKFINNLPFSGIAIGGVSVGESKKEMENVLKWTVPSLDDQRPRHLLGVGEIDDIFKLVSYGIDTFDCVMPTRLGRMGQVLVKNQEKGAFDFKIDISKSIYKADKNPLEKHCSCWVCQNFSRAYIHHLFKNRELLSYYLLTYHNVFFINNLVNLIRQAIKDDRLDKLEKSWIIK